MANDWTIAKVKDELPSVLVKLGESKHVHNGRLSGRLKEFPTVTVEAHDYNCKACKKTDHLRGMPWMDYEFSWQTIVNALNSGHELRA